MENKKQWIGLALCLAVAFSVLGYFGVDIYRQAPPIPEKVLSAEGRVLFTGEDIRQGQLVWQSTGGHQLGSIWGHGAYQAPDWSADWLHREGSALIELFGQKRFGKAGGELDAEQSLLIREQVKKELRHNGYDAGSQVLSVSAERAAAIEQVAAHYGELFSATETLKKLRIAYAMHNGVVKDEAKRRQLSAFFFWTAWACAARRPDSELSYTNNWPHEPLVGNEPGAGNFLWSMISIVLLLAAIGGLVWYHVRQKEEAPLLPPEQDPLGKLVLTPSMKALWKYCAVVILLLLVQVGLGGLTAHYTVEGQHFFGFPLAEYLPYAVTRTWHIQSGMFWIATAFLASGLFLAPMIGGREPAHQKLGVNILFGALLLVVTGSFTGEWLGVMQKLDLAHNFWFGHQGYEYIDLGRFWQILLFAGLLIWLVLVLRGLWPALQRRDSSRQLIVLFTLAGTAIGLFYGSGLFYSAKTHLSVMEYWRWWVVHLWVEGFFEVFATVAIATIFARLGLIRSQSATRASLISSSIFLVTGIPGTFHHLYFTGSPFSAIAIGASFSALEVVPLILVGFEASQTIKLGRSCAWMQRYKWPLTFFVGVAFWNFLGAGVFGFMINPPIALYYMQGLNTTPVHAHAALFGVYGLLSLGLTLMVLRLIKPQAVWSDRLLKHSFWGMNLGLGLMIALSLLPVGIAQTVASVEHGLWYARSAEFLQQGYIQDLRWLRLIGDSVFIYGVLCLVAFGLKLWRQPKTD